MTQTGAPVSAAAKAEIDSGGRIVLAAAEQPVHRLGIGAVELRGLGPHIVDRGERTSDRGPCGDPRFVDPAWSSGNVTLATSGADFARGVQWGAYDGSLFVATLKETDLRRFTLTGAVATQRDIFFDGTYGRLRTARQGPDGSLYLTTSNGSADRVIRITPTQ